MPHIWQGLRSVGCGLRRQVDRYNRPIGTDCSEVAVWALSPRRPHHRSRLAWVSGRRYGRCPAAARRRDGFSRRVRIATISAQRSAQAWS